MALFNYLLDPPIDHNLMISTSSLAVLLLYVIRINWFPLIALSYPTALRGIGCNCEENLSLWNYVCIHYTCSLRVDLKYPTIGFHVGRKFSPTILSIQDFVGASFYNEIKYFTTVIGYAKWLNGPKHILQSFRTT